MMDMSSEENNLRDSIAALETRYHMTTETIEKMLGFREGTLLSYLDGEDNLDRKEAGNLFMFCEILLEGVTAVDNDDRLRAVLDHLVELLGMTYQTLSIFSNVAEHEIKDFRESKKPLSSEMKYRLAVKSYYLLLTIVQNQE